ncbi:MAG: hypothetical protein GXO58_07045 [Thermodesulfobacteria bacterium]|nr:hypothetical protein [Thermodesulfobacteriota bacterium]
MILHLMGSELCFNQGCKIVESFLSLDPLIVNGLGALFFLALLVLFIISRKRRDLLPLVTFILLLAMVAEGILFSIQLFIAHTFCSYCLIIASIIVLIALIFDLKTALFGIAFALFEILIFSNIQLPFQTDRSVNLNQGTYAVKTCSNPRSVAYLIFSENCPHCKKVLANLQGCVKCEIHFNPVSKINERVLPGLIPIEGYRPEINILALQIFDIHSVPVLIFRTDEGYKIIKGDENIIRFIKNHCFCPASQVPELPFVEQIPLFDQDENGVCSLNEQCK